MKGLYQTEWLIEHLRTACRIVLTGLLFLYLPGGQLAGQPVESSRVSLFDHLSSSGQLIELALHTDMEELSGNRLRDDYQPGELYYTDMDGKVEEWEVGVVPRGRYRRRICTFPPIRLNFSKDQLSGRGLVEAFDKLKVVTHCLEGSEGDDYVLREYLAYLIYRQLTPNSYRVQLARITYHDTKGSYEKEQRFAILIEETDELAHRLGGVEFEGLNEPQEAFDTAAENLMAVYQYMIGNEDWSLVMLRNVKLIRPGEGELLIPVPYDFDFSGFVNTPYAVPNAQKGLSSIRQRTFMGHPVERKQLNQTLKHFRVYRSHIRSVIKNFEWLGFAQRMDAIEYIDSFYEMQSTLARENAKMLKAQKEEEEASAEGAER